MAKTGWTTDSRGDSGTRQALATVAAAAATPYGYTVSLWCSGAMLAHFRSVPDVEAVTLFGAGALTGFTLVSVVAQSALRTSGPAPPGSQALVAGALHWFAVGAAVGAAALIAQLPSELAWLLGSFAATTIYILGASLQLAFVNRWDRG